MNRPDIEYLQELLNSYMTLVRQESMSEEAIQEAKATLIAIRAMVPHMIDYIYYLESKLR